MREVLFICTGNYYRSRFAEAFFNHEAARRGLGWRAVSRGLAVHLAPPGGLSPHTAARLDRLGIGRERTAAWPTPVAAADLERAAVTVALKESEHRPLMARIHPDWEDRIEYWHVDDLDFAGPEEALEDIETQVRLLLDRLAKAEAGA